MSIFSCACKEQTEERECSNKRRLAKEPKLKRLTLWFFIPLTKTTAFEFQCHQIVKQEENFVLI